MMRILAAALSLFAFTSAAVAQNCAPRPDMVAKLEADYGEQLRFGGVQKTRGTLVVLEVWVSPKTGSYILLPSHPSGLSCMIAAGTDFFVAVPIAQDGDPT